ncbi:hypothetical protein ABIE18_002600 [Arthrobacter sp. 2762]
MIPPAKPRDGGPSVARSRQLPPLNVDEAQERRGDYRRERSLGAGGVLPSSSIYARESVTPGSTRRHWGFTLGNQAYDFSSWQRQARGECAVSRETRAQTRGDSQEPDRPTACCQAVRLTCRQPKNLDGQRATCSNVSTNLEDWGNQPHPSQTSTCGPTLPGRVSRAQCKSLMPFFPELPGSGDTATCTRQDLVFPGPVESHRARLRISVRSA